MTTFADAERGARDFRAALQRLNRIRNVRLRTAALKRSVARIAAFEQAALERAYGHQGGILGWPAPHAWPRIQRWCYRAVFVVVLAACAALAGVLGWLLFTTPTLGA